jgi:hypothetical protein
VINIAIQVEHYLALASYIRNNYLNLSSETTWTTDDYPQGKFKLLYFITTLSDNEEDAVVQSVELLVVHYRAVLLPVPEYCKQQNHQ